MGQRLCAVALILALPKTQLDFSHGEMERVRTLEGNLFNFTSIKLSTEPHPRVGPPDILFLEAPQELHFH